MVNVINVIDGLDIPCSDVRIDEEYNVIIGIKRYAFHLDIIEHQPIFKLPIFKGTHIFMTDEFRDRVIEEGLTGFDFTEVWDSEKPYDDEADRNFVVPVYEGPEHEFSEALELVDQHDCAIASERWKIQKDHENRFFLGTLTSNGAYFWIRPVAYSPSFLEMKWYVVDKSER